MKCFLDFVLGLFWRAIDSVFIAFMGGFATWPLYWIGIIHTKPNIKIYLITAALAFTWFVLSGLYKGIMAARRYSRAGKR